MLREETLQQTGRRQYEEPKGEFLEMIGSGSNTITVLTRIDSEKAQEEEEDVLPFDPSGFTVSELEDRLEGGDFTDNQLAALLAAEQSEKDRATATDAIESYQ